MTQLLAEAAAIVALVASIITGVAVIVGRLGVGRATLARRFAAWLDRTVGEVVEARLTGRNGGTSIMDAVDRIELEIKALHATQSDIGERVDRLSSDLAVQRQIGEERGARADGRIDALERQLDVLLHAVLQHPQPKEATS
jgi:hypothetical protein